MVFWGKWGLTRRSKRLKRQNQRVRGHFWVLQGCLDDYKEGVHPNRKTETKSF